MREKIEPFIKDFYTSNQEKSHLVVYEIPWGSFVEYEEEEMLELFDMLNEKYVDIFISVPEQLPLMPLRAFVAEYMPEFQKKYSLLIKKAGVTTGS